MKRLIRYLKILTSPNSKQRFIIETVVYNMIPVDLFINTEFDKEDDWYVINIYDSIIFKLNLNESKFMTFLFEFDEEDNVKNTKEETVDDIMLFIKKNRAFFRVLGYNHFAC